MDVFSGAEAWLDVRNVKDKTTNFMSLLTYAVSLTKNLLAVANEARFKDGGGVGGFCLYFFTLELALYTPNKSCKQPLLWLHTVYPIPID